MIEQDNQYSPLKILRHTDFMEDLKRFQSHPTPTWVPAPIKVMLVLSDLCNQDCSFCAYRIPQNLSSELFVLRDSAKAVIDHNPKRFFPVERSLDLIAELADIGTKSLILTGGGEPTVSPAFDQVVEAAKSRGMKVGLITNGQLLNRGGTLTAAAKCDWVRISVDASNAETYAKMRRVSQGSWLTLKMNVAALNSVRKEINPTMQLGFGFVVTADNQEEILAASRIAHEWEFDNFRISSFSSTETTEQTPYWHEAIKLARETELWYMGTGLQVYNQIGERHDQQTSVPKNKTCHYQQAATFIGADMNVYRCCLLSYNNRGIVGSIKDQPFWKLWRSADRIHDIVNFDATGCTNCTYQRENEALAYAVSKHVADEDFV